MDETLTIWTFQMLHKTPDNLCSIKSIFVKCYESNFNWYVNFPLLKVDINNFRSVLAISWDISDYLKVHTRTSAYNGNKTPENFMLKQSISNFRRRTFLLFHFEECSVHFLRCPYYRKSTCHNLHPTQENFSYWSRWESCPGKRWKSRESDWLSNQTWVQDKQYDPVVILYHWNSSEYSTEA